MNRKLISLNAVRKIWITACVVFISTLSLFAQGVRISGVIIDVNGEPVIGANVVEKGTTNGNITDIDGKFTLQVSPNATLIISYIGFNTQEIAVGNRTAFDITLIENNLALEEVVVVGYGTQKKVNLTGSVSTVSGEDLIKRPVTNPVTMLQGQIPGLSITQGTGQPGSESVTMRIRGQGTYSNAGSDPLVLIDGVPGNLSNLNANDIENVSVLKDASSAAIYGARAANGVILVTTKSGEENHFRLAYNVNIGIHNPTSMIKSVTNSAAFMRLYNEAVTNSGIANASNVYTDEMISLYENATDRTKYPNFDWLGYGLNSALVQNHDISISGGAKGTTYNISVGYVNQPGTLIGFGFEKYNARVNLQSQLNSWLRVGTNLSLERGDIESTAQGQSDAVISLMAQAPTYSPKLPDGSGYSYSAYSFEYHNKNQVAIVDNNVTNNSVNYDASAQLWLEMNLCKGLTWYTKGAVNFTDNTAKDWRPVVPLYNFHTGTYATDLDVGTTGLNVTNQRTFYTNLFSYLKYETTLNGGHHIGAQAGYSQETNRFDNLKGYRQKFLSDLHELNAGTTDIQTATGFAYEWALRSFFGRLNYDYQGRYLAEVNVRYDGTSRMADDKRWGYFPSFSAGWRLSEEKFIKDLEWDWLDNFKVRGSYGLLGNQNINVGDQPYPYQSLLSYTGNYPFDNNGLSTGVAQTGYSNKSIKWEATSVFDIGLDLTLFKGLSVSYDYYKKNTTDILRSAQVSALIGLDAPIVNSGAMINYGHEVAVQYTDVIKGGTFKGLNYGGSFYINKYKNEAAKFGAEEISGYYIRKNGVPYNSYYMIECIGVFQTQEEINSSPKQFSDNVKPGDLKYRDANKDGVVDNDDRVIIPGKFPKFDYSFSAFANWKGFDVSAFLQGVEGQRIYANEYGIEPFIGGSVPNAEWLTDRWTGPGTSNWLPRITFNNSGNSQNRRSSSWFLQDNSYLRLKNLTVGYTLPHNIASHIKCEKVRLYFSGDNLFTITSFKDGFDPERAGDGRFAVYPQNKIVSFGLNVEF
ncbi:MAG: TonB-dependent receptor [Tannerella sp.]|jgi:TonB-linked SusC/RagA family outer membrane protein|nr:TonB-dependent receptor [Tannerella sp.]